MTQATEEKDIVWSTRDGRRMLVSEMTEDHAKAALRMVIRQYRRKQVLFSLLAAELKWEFDRTAAKRALEDQQLHEDIMNEVMAETKP